jgi:hypothetical protein
MAEAPETLDRALRDLARAIETATPSAGLTTAVLERVATEPAPEPSTFRIAAGRWGDWLRARLRWVIGLLLALTLTGVAVSPVGAEVAHWFGFHGVVVSPAPGRPSGSPEVPRADGGLTLGEAEALVDFKPGVPTRLGPPDGVSVSADRRLLSMSWDASSGAIRLDQFDAALSPQFWKQSDNPVPVRVSGHEGLWFEVPHEVAVLDDAGEEKWVPPRLAAQTLIWVEGARTFRLEGELTLAEALQAAESMH